MNNPTMATMERPPDHPRRNYTKIIALCATHTVALILLLCVDHNVTALELDFGATDHSIQQVVMSTLPAQRIENLSSPNGLPFWSRRLQRDGAEALQALGYYHAKLNVDTRNVKQIIISVEAGPQVVLSSVDIDIIGADLPQLKQNFALTAGDALNHGDYESNKREILKQLLAQGYLHATLEQGRIIVDRQSNTAQIILTYQAGPQFYVSQARFSNTNLSAEFLQRYVAFEPGDPLNETMLQHLSLEMRNSGYFSEVELLPLLKEADSQNRVPLEIRTVPIKRSVYEAGLSVGTDRGPGLELGITRRRSNAKGHRWQATSEVSVRRQFLAGRYELPNFKRLGVLNTFDANITREQTDATDRVTSKLTFNHQDLWHDWRRTRSVSVLDERYIVAQDELDSTLILGSIEYFKRRSNDVITPTKGWRLRSSLSLASRALGSSTDVSRFEASGKAIGSVGEHGRWLARARIGTVLTSDFSDLPSSLRFYSGGDNSVRGYDFQSLSPQDQDGNLLGGRSSIEASLEFDYLVGEKWRVALFADAGSSFGRGQENIGYGAGLGMRWLSPVGPLRLDLAAPLSGDDRTLRIHFSAGPDL